MQGSPSKAYLYKRIVQAKLYIDAHYEEPIDLRQIAGEACFSRFHFIRLFRSAYGRTPHSYLVAVRLKAAAGLLASGMAVKDACFRVGFESASTFPALFRKYTGMTPSAFRERARLRREAIARQPLRFIPGCFAASNGWKSNFEEAR
jgi:AraC-like DNA-binding protein